MLSLLDDRLLSIRINGREDSASLPDVLAMLGETTPVSFAALQAHQQSAWYCFLVQVAAMASARSRAEPRMADEWRGALVTLSSGQDEPWHLVVPDLGKAAFMQSPIPGRSPSLAGFVNDIETPDQLDVLVTSKNHDVKRSRIVQPRFEHWLYALVALQTTDGYPGAGNYGIVRMNGGYGNRPLIGLAGALSWNERFTRDVTVLRSARTELSVGRDPNGLALVWMEPWDGAAGNAVSLSSCDPYFVEICRRIRFVGDGDSIACWRATSKDARIAAGETHGNTGDPWTPVRKADAKALSIGSAGIGYRLLSELLLGAEYSQPHAMRFQADERDGAFLIARALVRGKGKTEGLHEKVIPIRPAVVSWLRRNPKHRTILASRAQSRIQKAEETRGKLLYPVIIALVRPGPNTTGVDRWTTMFEREIDARFFDALWESIDLDEEAAQAAWQKLLLPIAERVFREAERSVPMASSSRWKVRSAARSIFDAKSRTVLPLAFPEKPVLTPEPEE